MHSPSAYLQRPRPASDDKKAPAIGTWGVGAWLGTVAAGPSAALAAVQQGSAAVTGPAGKVEALPVIPESDVIAARPAGKAPGDKTLVHLGHEMQVGQGRCSGHHVCRTNRKTSRDALQSSTAALACMHGPLWQQAQPHFCSALASTLVHLLPRSQTKTAQLAACT
jgi:hypothetical protein